MKAILDLQRTVGDQAGERRLEVNAMKPGRALTPTGIPRFENDLSRIPPSSPRHAVIQPERPPRLQSVSPVAEKGEVPGDEVFSPLKGEPGAGAEGESAAKGEGAKTVKKTELGAPTAGQCGAYSWKVRFSIDNAEATTTGYIVQKVDAKYNRTDCAGKDKPVTGIGTFPFWEAWGVRGGKVFIGDTANAHNADTYADGTMGDGTKGSIVVKGVPEFFPNVTLPAHMKANNPDTQAGDLRSSVTDPALTGGTGAISHDLTASWECCPSVDKKTTFSDKK
ncbi:MAG: hypothetical protein OES32_07210 [Acidobacteriota bacterium]|nr:hypothetical protein [Acidobacteriota bacterium]MDH3523360.1 hypothetical protein [Acidobacteriota bacterium]